MALFAMRCAFALAELVCGIALARHLGTYQYGAYALAMSWVALLVVPAAMGFDRLLVREVAVLRSSGSWGGVRGILRFSHQVTLLVATLLGGLVAIAFEVMLREDAHTARAVQLAMVMVPIIAVGRLRQAALQGLGHPLAGFTPEWIVQPLAMLAFLAVWVLADSGRGSGIDAVTLQIGTCLIAFAVGTVLLRGRLPRGHESLPEHRPSKAWLIGALPFVWMLSMNAVMTNADTVIVGLFNGADEAGIYRVASQMAMLALLPATTVNFASAAKIAALHAEGRKSELQEAATAAARLTSAATVVAAIPLIVFGKHALAIFGSQFVEGYSALVVLVACYAACSLAGVAGYLLIMTQYARTVSVVATFGTIVSLAACVILVPRIGMQGAAFATGIATVLVSTSYASLAHMRLKVHTTPLPGADHSSVDEAAP